MPTIGILAYLLKKAEVTSIYSVYHHSTSDWALVGLVENQSVIKF